MFNYTRLQPTECDFIEVASLDDLPEGERLFLDIDEVYLVMFNIAGHIYAIADVCSHDDGPLGDGELEGMDLSCPRHGAKFDIRSGKALSLPAVVDIPVYPVQVREQKIFIGLPLK